MKRCEGCRKQFEGLGFLYCDPCYSNMLDDQLDTVTEIMGRVLLEHATAPAVSDDLCLAIETWLGARHPIAARYANQAIQRRTHAD